MVLYSWLISIDSTTDTGVLAFNVSHLIMDPLVKRNAKMEYEPLLATSWSFPDPKTIWFKIRQGVTFHDGSPVTAEDRQMGSGRWQTTGAQRGRVPQVAPSRG